MAEEILYGRTLYTGGEERKTGYGRILVTINIVLALVLAGEIVFHLLIAPNLVIRRVLVESELHLDESEILRIAGISRKEYYFSLDRDLIRRNLESNPLIRKAYIEKVFPDSLRVVLYGRNPLALSFVEMNGKTIPVMIDESGIAYRTAESTAVPDLPVISGIRFENFRPGMRLPDMMIPFLKELASVREQSPGAFRFISELRIVQTGDRDFEVLLFPVNHQVSVRIGSEINEKLCRYIMMVLDVIGRERAVRTVNELDFRTGEVVYRTREE